MKTISNNKKWWVLAGVSIASFLGCIDFTIVNTALPAIQADLKTSMSELQWIINIFILALSSCMVIMGRMADIYGRRRLLYCGMIAFGASSLGAGLSINIDWLILFRLIQGISCSILYTATGAIVSNAFPPNQRGKAIGTLFGINGIGLAIGPVLGGLFVSGLSWRWVFFINVPLILISLMICFINVDESRSEEENKGLDWPGLTTLTLALSTLILSITQGDTWGWTSVQTCALFAFSIAMFLLFYYFEKKSFNPIINFDLFVNRTFIVSIVATVALAFFYCTAFFLIPLYLNLMLGKKAFMVGLMLLPITATVALISPVVGKFVDKHGPKMPLVFGLGCFTISAITQLFFTASSPLILIFIAFIIMGFGWASILGPSTVAALASVPESSGAVAMGSSWTLHNVGGAIGLALGLLAYRSASVSTLISKLSIYHVNKGAWIDGIISNPRTAMNILQEHLPQHQDVASDIFHSFFMAGFHQAMILLSISSFIAMTIIMLGMKNKVKVSE